MKKTIIFVAVIALTMVTFTSCTKEENDSNENGNNPAEEEIIEEWVDLDLPSGLLWCSHNVGAKFPENYGNYYAWGETTAKDRYDWMTYQYINNENNQKLTKYCNNSYYGHDGFTDNLTVLEPEDDAATVNMGDGTRTPTIEEWMELINNTTSTWTQVNGVNGRTYKGANGNSIFLPATGYYEGTGSYSVLSRGIYWSASLDTETSPRNAQAFDFSSSRQGKAIYYRSTGFTVRAVCERKK